MVHGVGEFFEGPVEGQRLPAFAAVQRQAVSTGTEWSESESGVESGVLVRDAVTATIENQRVRYILLRAVAVAVAVHRPCCDRRSAPVR
jgi:hypothetical protein